MSPTEIAIPYNPVFNVLASGNLILGAGEGTTPVATTVRGPAAVGTNVAGADLTFDASNGTGTGGSGALIFRTAPTAASSSTANTLTEVVRIAPTGKVGSNTNSPQTAVDVVGQVRSRFNDAGSSTAINWDNGNAQLTSAVPGALTFTNMQDGGAYTLALSNATSGTFTFSQAGLTFLFRPGNGNTTANTTTIFTFLRMGSNVYVTWISGFQ